MAEILVKSRGILKSKITRISQYVDKFDTEDVNEIVVRENLLNKTFKEYEEVQEQLEEVSGELYGLDREITESKYLTTLASMNRILRGTSTGSVASNDSTSEVSRTTQSGNLKLPSISLPSFGGNYGDWYSFRDLYKDMIHNNDGLSSIQKFYYLKSSLKGDALALIKAITVTAANYETAWDSLCNRFDNKLVIINTHLRALFEIKPLTKCSGHTLRNLIQCVNQNLECLKGLKIDIKSWDLILIYLIGEKLDPLTRRDWEYGRVINTIPTMEEFMAFIEHRCSALEVLGNVDKGGLAQETKPQFTTTYVATRDYLRCILCNKEHKLSSCERFVHLSANERRSYVRSKGLCYNCLVKGHPVTNCRVRVSCVTCKRRHHTLLHVSERRVEAINDQPETSGESNQKGESQKLTQSVLFTRETHREVLLSTVTVMVKTRDGKWMNCRALLDSGAQASFITKGFLEKLQVKPVECYTNVQGIAGGNQIARVGAYLTVKSKTSQFTCSTRFIVLEKISSKLPHRFVRCSHWNIPPKIQLADPSFNFPTEVDMLLGAELFFKILKPGRINLGTHLPILQDTAFGWVVSGAIMQGEGLVTSVNLLSFADDINNLIPQFWRLEELTNPRSMTLEEKLCEESFSKTTRRTQSGRYIVEFPIREDGLSKLGNSKACALRQFLSLERRLARDSKLYERYREFMQDYLKLGHMELSSKEVETHGFQGNGGEIEGSYFIPHHPVINNNSSTTKLRVVFNASMKTSSGASLNDVLLVGPTVQSDLVSILINFRRFKFVLTTDIKMMYRQILIIQKHRKLQQIFWRNCVTDKIASYYLKTVTYGTASAPYLATRCLKQLADDEGKNYPLASECIYKDVYVDDILTGANSIEELKQIKRELITLLKLGGFELHKWTSNVLEIRDSMSKDNFLTDQRLFIGDGNPTRTLGLIWDPKVDQFKLSIPDEFVTKLNSKREVLSCISRIFDPLGLIGPVTIEGKILMQEIWKAKVEWDEELGTELLGKWIELRNSFGELKQLTIPRRLFGSNNPANVSFHGFADASAQAYGCCLYLRVEEPTGEVLVNLVSAKSRVAPLKQVSLPRLELCAFLLLTRLIHSVTSKLQFKVAQTVMWSDSEIVLAWLKSSPSRWNVFVANRVSEIQELAINASFRHVASADNPSDHISRGLKAHKLLKCYQWWHGPSWLSKHCKFWPAVRNPKVEKLLEQREVATVGVTKIYQSEIFERFSRYLRLQRVMAYILRFVKNSRPRSNRLMGPLSVDELDEAQTKIIKMVQEDGFSEDLKNINSAKTYQVKALKSLTPFLDQAGILRVGGRLKNANLRFSQQHPIILPARHRVTTMILQQEHVRLMHAGQQTVLASIRTRFWPINARNEIRSIIHKCVVCVRLKADAHTQLMGNLPRVRVTPARAFLKVGVDYGGPIPIKQSSLRNSKITKGYIALFVCMVTKAIHLELVSDMTTEAFIAALRRFIGRRGKCSEIFSDNGSNFKGAANELNHLHDLFMSSEYRANIQELSSVEGIKWHFIPPYAPHFGGLWEAGIKSVKHHLRRVLGNRVLTFEQLNTVLISIEAILNSRPLCALTDDSSEIKYLSPGHFLISDSLTSFPEPNLGDLNAGRLSVWQHIVQVRDLFWKRWHTDYLNELQQKGKWQAKNNLWQVGTVVLLKEENLSPLNWQLGRIHEVVTGDDNCVRVAVVKTSGGMVKRAVCKLVPLPVE